MMEDETASFSAYFGGQTRRASASPDESSAQVHEVVLPLHDEALQQLTQIARAAGIDGSNEYMRSVALQITLDRFTKSHDGDLFQDRSLHFSEGPIKERTLCLFADTLTDIARLERDLHCSETILIETAIQEAART
jgi:hypothetical protein